MIIWDGIIPLKKTKPTTEYVRSFPSRLTSAAAWRAIRLDAYGINRSSGLHIRYQTPRIIGLNFFKLCIRYLKIKVPFQFVKQSGGIPRNLSMYVIALALSFCDFFFDFFKSIVKVASNLSAKADNMKGAYFDHSNSFMKIRALEKVGVTRHILSPHPLPRSPPPLTIKPNEDFYFS